MTATFEALLKNDLEHAQRELLEEVDAGRLSAHDVQDILLLLSDLHFPGLITLLALGARTTGQEGRIAPFPLTKQNIADALDSLPSKHEPAKQAARMLSTGQFFGDMTGAFAAIVHAVPGLPLDVAQDLRTLPHLPRRLVLAITRDLGDAPSMVDTVMRDLQTDGMIHSHPKILDHTIRVLYRQATARQIATTIHRLLGNESVRLALIVFARSKGVTISQEDLDHVRKAINPSEPNLGGLLMPGLQQLNKRFGNAHAMELLEEFALR